ncbi:MAG: vanadium-dependent haloperoxidase [Actinomycetota bacterium]
MRRRFVSLVSVVVLAGLAGVLAPAAPAVAQINEVTNWNRIATSTLVQFPPLAGGAPPALQVNMGMVQGAVYDAVNAIEPRHEPYLLQTTFPSTASKEAAVATAAFTVLSDIIAGVPDTVTFPPFTVSFPNEGALQTSISNGYAASMAAIPDGQSKTDGIAAGIAAAEAMIAARQGDGRFGPSQWHSNTAVGHWQPLLDANQMPILDPTPWVGGVEPFLMQSSSQFRTDGPNALTSNAYAKDVNEVKALGGNGIVGGTPSARTPEQTHNAVFWQSTGGPTLLWNDVARDLVEDPGYAVGIDDSALLFGMLNLSSADAAINCWNDKYHFDFWRPWQAIREADRDDNRKTEPDTSWTSLLTAPYPEHPSGHLCLDGAYLHVLRSFFGKDKISFGVTSSQFGGETRFFGRFSKPLKEIIEARIWAGLHFRTADVQGAELGRNVAEYMEENYFQPLD